MSWPIPEFANYDDYYAGPGQSEHAALYKFSIEHPEKFWGRLALSRLRWHREFDSVIDCSHMASGKMKWFIGGKLNIAGLIIENDAIYYSLLIYPQLL